MPNHNLLFVSHYIEVLRVFLPHIRYFINKGFNVKILCQLSDEEEMAKHKKLLEGLNLDVDFIQMFKPDSHTLWSRSFFFKLLLSFLYPFYLTSLARRRSFDILINYKPFICIFGSEYNNLNRQFFHNCNKLSIKTFLIQWTLAPPDINLAFLSKRNKKETSNYKSYVKKQLLRAANFPNTILYNFFNYKSSLKKVTHFSGGGKSDKFFVISSKSAEFYLKSGVSPSKLKISGHPLYEESLNQKYKSTANKYFTILWANNETRYIYSNKYNHDEMVESWESKIRAIFEVCPDIRIKFKIHPNWDNPADFSFIKSYENIELITEGNIELFIQESDLVISSFSSSMIYSIIRNIPTISYQFPNLPGSDAYGILGGTIHSANLIEFKESVSSIFNRNQKALEKFSRNRSKFLTEILGLNIARIQKGITSSKIIEREIYRTLDI